MNEMFAWTFLGGRRVIKTISATAGNVVTDLSPGDGKRWLVLFGRITLTTDATVANRKISYYLRDGSGDTNFLGASNAIPENSTGVFNLHQHYEKSSNVGEGGEDHIGVGLILLEDSDQLRITISNGQAGDSYSGKIVVLEVDV